MKQKKLMLLGGSRFLRPVIETAKKLGIYTITVDYLPDNDAHKISDKYLNVSIIDKDLVLKVAQSEAIDGIMAFACDPAVTTAAYVAEELDLPFQCSYESTCILQNKVRFRQFLRENGFNCPFSIGFDSIEAALSYNEEFAFPVIVKPADSAGSKGVTRVSAREDYHEAIIRAFDNSISKSIIVEDFLDVVGAQSSTDMFTVEGELVNPIFSDQVFDKNATNPYVPTIEMWPTTMPENYQKDLVDQLNKLFKLLHCKNGLYNIECRVCSNGKAYLMEVSPRGGGNHIAYIQDMAYGLNFIENEIRNAVNLPLMPIQGTPISGCWCTYSLHPSSGSYGKFGSINFVDEIKKKIKMLDICIKKGDVIEPFSGANMSWGDLIIQFDNYEELHDTLINQSGQWMQIEML